MIGIELKQKVAPYIKALQERKIIALNAGMTVIRLLPPLVITYLQIDHVVDALTEVLSTDFEADKRMETDTVNG
jgi:acetylornithine/LysW-gamma-L-lysine aminotransferase